MFRVAIVEDEDACAQMLQSYLDRFSAESGEQFQVTRFRSGGEILDEYRPVWDIILMDIMMPGVDGLRASRRIRETDPAVVLIFITNMAKFAIRGYEVDALDFVLKPVKYPHFALKLKKAVAVAGQRVERYLMVNVEGESRRIAAGNILYIEVFNHRLHLHTVDAEYRIRGSLQEMEAQLSGLPFVRCSHSYLVNLARVDGIRKGCLLLPGQEIPISRQKQKEVLEKLSDFLGGGLR